MGVAYTFSFVRFLDFSCLIHYICGDITSEHATENRNVLSVFIFKKNAAYMGVNLGKILIKLFADT